VTAAIICILLFGAFLWVMDWDAKHNGGPPPPKWKKQGDHPFKFVDGVDKNAHHSDYDSSGGGHYR
jgi:hypothetical protein